MAVEGHLGAESAGAWHASGQAALSQVLRAIEQRRWQLPSAIELWDWYQDVLLAVNSDEEGSLDRLIGGEGCAP